MAELIYKDECYRIYGICYEIQNTVGSVFNERQYQDIFEAKLKTTDIPYEREKELFFEMKDGTKVTGNKADFIVFDKIVIDFKTKKFITKEDFKQMMRYLRAGRYKLGLIVNFRSRKVAIKRVINSAV